MLTRAGCQVEPAAEEVSLTAHLSGALGVLLVVVVVVWGGCRSVLRNTTAATLTEQSHRLMSHDMVGGLEGWWGGCGTRSPVCVRVCVRVRVFARVRKKP